MKYFITQLLFILITLSLQYNSYAKKVGVKVSQIGEAFDLYLGYRLQSLLTQSQVSSQRQSDLNLRRLRLNLKIQFKNQSFFYADIRNDNVDFSDEENNVFEIGDAYYNLDINKHLTLRFLRAKVDISRSQTSSSANLIFPNRTLTSDFASDFIVASRRATNLQINGNYQYLSYQFAISDSLSSSSLIDINNDSVSNILSKNLALGAKIKIHPLKNWRQKNVKEADHDSKKYLNFAAGFFYTPSIEFETSSIQQEINRSLLNLEFAFKYRSFSFQAEYFKFQGVIESFNISPMTNSQFNIGSSEGYQFIAEYQIAQSKFSPFVRYENWNRFEQIDQDHFESSIIGVNYYYNKNQARFGLAYQQDRNTSFLNQTNRFYHLYALFNY